jgi:hypothetical protein
MTAFPGLGHPTGKEAPIPEPSEMTLAARIEGLAGEELALLAIPAHERSRAQHERLRAIADELDRAFQTLKHRAHRLGRPDAASEQA